MESQDATSPNAKTITDCMKGELVTNDQDVQNLLSLASDGASVMVGKNRGMSALLKKRNPRMINVHCICHQLALACGDTSKQVQCMPTIECLLADILKLLRQDSCLSEDPTWT